MKNANITTEGVDLKLGSTNGIERFYKFLRALRKILRHGPYDDVCKESELIFRAINLERPRELDPAGEEICKGKKRHVWDEFDNFKVQVKINALRNIICHRLWEIGSIDRSIVEN